MAVVNGTAGKDFIHRLGDNAVVPAGFNDVVGATLGNDTIFGLADNDIILADGFFPLGVTLQGGDDILDGGPGGDQLNGGPGFNYASYQDATAAVTANLAAPGGNTGDAAGDTYAQIQGLIGSDFADTLIGDTNVNTLRGGKGGDVLVGGGAPVGSFDTVDYSDVTAGVTVNLLDPTKNADAGKDDYAKGDTYPAGDIAGLIGSNFSDTLVGNNLGDTIDGGKGNDTLTGGTGFDTFIFSPGYGSDTVTNFAGDRINLKGFAIQSFAAVQALARQVGPDTFFDFGNGDTLTLSNVKATNLVAGNFTLSPATGYITPFLGSKTFGANASAGGWTSQNAAPRVLADVGSATAPNGPDGKADIIGFGDPGVYVSINNGDGTFQTPTLVLPSFGATAGAGGWASQNATPRTLADLTGDGAADIIGFGEAGTYIALDKGNGTFNIPNAPLKMFGSSAAAGGWTSQDAAPRTAADVNGDHFADLVGFGEAGAYVALGKGDGTFFDPILASNGFGSTAAAGGWKTNDAAPRILADVNGDGRADIIGFGDAGAYVAFGKADGTFDVPFLASTSFGSTAAAGGWTSQNAYPRTAADVNGDGRADIIGFGDGGTYVALARSDGTFATPIPLTADFGRSVASGSWTSQDLYPRSAANLNGDGRADLVGFGAPGTYVSLATGIPGLVG